ncbi:MAG: hypothetical protein PWQ29_766 [Verrucomicrobiota bacterium]|jgi:uncharacterized integral membrane protein|nr:hypothetical protein [Verrucomicrobiota bacterium]MDK2963372.1 hypothetical protein [Verrucomicrobiota bacterium]
MKNMKFILCLTFGILLLILLFQNIAAVSFQFFFWKVRISPVVLFLCMLLIGLAAGFLIARRTRS